MTKSSATVILKKLRPLYAPQPMGIDFETSFQLVVGTILSAQCTDVRVNQVTKKFFDKLREPADFIKIGREKLETLIKSTGFYRNKAKSIIGAAEMILAKHHGEVPCSMAELIKIPGFGRKTANVILSRLYGINEGVCVDTHVLRLSKRLGLTDKSNAVQVERDLMKIVPQKHWHEITHFLILHGRQVCQARSPRCSDCVLASLCPSKKTLAR